MAHDWVIGSVLPTGVVLATCAHCETLRATEVDSEVDSERPAVLHFFRRRADEAERVTRIEPACIAPPRFFTPPW
jgi:hypothetical protein